MRFLLALVASSVICLAIDFVDGPFIFDARMFQHERIYFPLMVPFLTSFSSLLLSACLEVDKAM